MNEMEASEYAIKVIKQLGITWGSGVCWQCVSGVHLFFFPIFTLTCQWICSLPLIISTRNHQSKTCVIMTGRCN
jgi:hypothetical protein